MTAVALAVCAAAVVALVVPPRTTVAPPPSPPSVRPDGWMRRQRPWWSGLAGAAAASFVPSPLSWVAAPVCAVAVWVLIGRSEGPTARRERERARRDLPHVVGLLADALRAGGSPGECVALVTEALPGPASDRLASALPRLRLGLAPEEVWSELARDPVLAPLGRALERAGSTGSSVVEAVERVAAQLADDARGEVEDRARAVGVKAAVPLGLCLLPSFVLLGIVPVVAGMLGTLGL